MVWAEGTACAEPGRPSRGLCSEHLGRCLPPRWPWQEGRPFPQPHTRAQKACLLRRRAPRGCARLCRPVGFLSASLSTADPWPEARAHSSPQPLTGRFLAHGWCAGSPRRSTKGSRGLTVQPVGNGGPWKILPVSCRHPEQQGWVPLIQGDMGVVWDQWGREERSDGGGIMGGTAPP